MHARILQCFQYGQESMSRTWGTFQVIRTALRGDSPPSLRDRSKQVAGRAPTTAGAITLLNVTVADHAAWQVANLKSITTTTGPERTQRGRH